MQWSLIYAHDRNGRPVDGELSELIEAIQHGAEVRYYVDYAEDGPGCYKEAQALWIRDGQVYAQNTTSVSCCFDSTYVAGETAAVAAGYEKEGLRFLDDPYFYFQIVSTLGDTDMSRWSVGEHKLRRRDQKKYAIKWFVRQ
jgi:hypothetical protein